MTPSVTMIWCDFMAAILSRNGCFLYFLALLSDVKCRAGVKYTIIKYKYKYAQFICTKYKYKYKYIELNKIEIHFSHLIFPIAMTTFVNGLNLHCLFNVQSPCHKHVINCLVKTTTYIYTQKTNKTNTEDMCVFAGLVIISKYANQIEIQIQIFHYSKQ